MEKRLRVDPGPAVLFPLIKYSVRQTARALICEFISYDLAGVENFFWVNISVGIALQFLFCSLLFLFFLEERMFVWNIWNVVTCFYLVHSKQIHDKWEDNPGSWVGIELVGGGEARGRGQGEKEWVWSRKMGERGEGERKDSEGRNWVQTTAMGVSVKGSVLGDRPWSSI